MGEIKMPQLGETVTEGTITKWFKQVGDEVQEDEPLFEVSTDKVDSEVPSPESGYLTEIKVDEGDTVEVGAVLAVIGDSAGAEAAPAREEPAQAEEPAEAQQPEPVPAEEAEEVAEVGEAQEEAPTEAPAADLEPEPEPEREPAPPPREPEPARAAATPSGPSQLLSPVVRRLITEHNLDPNQIQGTGAGGRITRNDVLAVVERGDGGRAPAPERAPEQPREPARDRPAARAEAPAPAAPAAQPPARAGERDETVPFTNIRRRTAEHMRRSKATSAHTLVAIEADYAGVEAVRREMKDEFRASEGFGLSYLPFVSRAVVDAISEFPQMNASVGDDELIVHHYVNLGIAVDLDFHGLMVPVVRDADSKRLRAIAREIADLASRARAKKLSPDEIAGGTFTITNPGPFGTLLTGPIINQPQVAILSTDGVKKRPVVVELDDGSDGIAIHPVGILALSFDHRAIDGAYASAFVAKVKEILETRDWATEL